MKITRDDLFIQLDPNQSNYFEEWQWLIGDNSRVFLATSLGDAFFQREDGVFWLNVGDGTFDTVAESINEFQAMLSSPENINEWFIPQLVGDILQTGLTRNQNECFGFKKAPVLGGEYDPDNFEATDLSVHFSILGQIHEQVKDLPEGTPISEIKIK